MKLFHILLVIITVGLFSCDDPQKDLSQYETTISGVFYNIAGDQVILAKQTPEGIFSVDTTYLDDNGEFLFTPEVEETELYRVMLGFDQYITLAVTKGEHIFIDADGLDVYDNYIVEGSHQSDLIRVVTEEAMRYAKEFDSTKVVINHEKAAKNGKGLMAAFEYQKLLHANHQQFIVDFIAQYPGSIASYFLIVQLPLEEQPDLYKKVATDLTASYPNWEFTEALLEHVSILDVMNEGLEAAELAFQNPDGDTVRLTDLRGNYVLIDFWASWCVPCRNQNPDLVALYNKFHPYGFEIYGYSLDQQKDPWIEAIKQDQLPWLHASDLQGWAAKGSLTYGVQAIPASFLIDPAGIVDMKNPSLEDLEAKLMEIYADKM